MKTFARRLASSLVLLACLAGKRAPACGPFFERAIFVHEVHPDFPLEEFAAGTLGILRPSYARSYLAVAYRHLSGVGLDSAEQAAVRALWDKRLGVARPSEVESAPEEKWFQAREVVTGKSDRPAFSSFKTMSGVDYYFEFLNCNPSAFLVAAETLGERMRSLGAQSAAVREWVAAQETVFGNCSGQGPKNIPPPLPPTAPATARADRNYQIASALFYSGSYPEAESAFRAIARDSTSPWRSMAPYLAVRAMLRRATVSGGGIDRELIGRARKELEAILVDPSQQKIHEPSRRLLAFAILRSDPASAALVKSKELLRKGAGSGLAATLDDYTFALDALPSPLPEAIQTDDLTDWILTFQASTDEARARAYKRWAQTKSLPWLVAALTKARPGDAETNALVEAGKKIPPSSVGWIMTAYQLARLESESGKRNEARERLDVVLGAKASLPASARNELLALRLGVASSVAEALRFASRVPSTLSLGEDGRELPSEESSDGKNRPLTPLLDEDAGTLFNKGLPLERWREAAKSKDLPEGIRKRLALAGWVRAALLDDTGAATEFGRSVAESSKDLSPAIAEYEAAKTKDERLFLAVLTLLRNPGLRPTVETNVPRDVAVSEIDNFRNNWWCGPTAASTGDNKKPAVSFAFVPPAEAARASEEAARLEARGTAPNFLSQTVIDYVNRSGGGERGAEALHLAVRSTRYGCTDEATTRFSKAAFQLLKKKFPKSSWAAKTKYWY